MKQYSKEVLDNVKTVANQRPLPADHKNYLFKIKNQYEFIPKTIYDIGSCVLHWASEAQNTWQESKIILFDATDIFEELYIEKQYTYNICVLSNEDNKIVNFYQNNNMFAGNSYYRENPKHSPAAQHLFDDSKIVKLKTKTLDSIVNLFNYDLPDLIKIDVQGAELDVLMGAKQSLQNCKHLIVELRSVEYNIGSPEKEVIIEYLASQGFKNMGMFSNNGPDGDYHFMR